MTLSSLLAVCNVSKTGTLREARKREFYETIQCRKKKSEQLVNVF